MLEGAALTRFLLEKHGRSWDDVALPGVSLADLDGRILDEYRHRGVESQRLPPQALNESDEGVIERLRLRDGAHLKRAAVLLFHPEPHRFFMEASVKIGAFRGAELLYQDVIEGDLFTQVDRVIDLLYTKYSRGLVSYNDIYRVETFPVPRAAMREAVVNAVVHRDYATPASTQIRVYDDRITLRNAAQLPPDWTAPVTGGLQSRPPQPAGGSRLLSRGNDRSLGARDPPHRGVLSGSRESRADLDPGARRRSVSAVSVLRGVPGCRPGGSPDRTRAKWPQDRQRLPKSRQDYT